MKPLVLKALFGNESDFETATKEYIWVQRRDNGLNDIL